MHFPGLRVKKEMYSEAAALWFSPSDASPSESLLLKLSTTSLKSVMQGSTLEVLLSNVQGHLCWCARISDVPTQPLTVVGVLRHPDEYEAAVRVFQKASTTLFLFNENDFCVAWADVTFASEESACAEAILAAAPITETVPFDTSSETALDAWQEQLNKSNEVKVEAPGGAAVVLVKPALWATAKISVVGQHDVQHFDIGDSDEGRTLESIMWSALESVFPLTLHHSPQVTEGKTERELIDLIATHELGIFLFEAKDLAVIRANPQRSHARRVATLRKHILTAISQLKAAVKVVQDRTEVRTKDGKVIPLNTEKPMSGIILVTEFVDDDEWEDVFMKLCKASLERQCLFHVLDLRELVTMLKIAKGNSMTLDYMLMERAKLSVEHSALHVRSRVVTRPPLPS